ncbi:MAG TPA: hypothetical protein VN811_16720 [Thermoanaerobaculia bacterium]|nr:hypothetical protein [Thermoanaerobaculia bacterium]
MLDSLYARISAWNQWPLLALVIVIAVLCSQGFDRRKGVLKAACVKLHPGDERCEGELTLDSRVYNKAERRLGYNQADVRTLLDLLGEKGRRIYGQTELSLDLAFPIVYGLLFVILLAHLFSARHAWVLLFPLAGVTFDVLENVSVATMALTNDEKLAAAASAFTLTKSAFLLASALLIIFGALRGLFGHGA